MDYVVGEAKIRRYLLTNPKKCGFFIPVGYTVEDWARLRDDLRDIVTQFPVIARRTTVYGVEYEVVGEVLAPNGRFVRQNEPDRMYFVTAYPA